MMEIFTRMTEWRARRGLLPPHQSLGFVPTMGNLHAGHASLLLASQQQNDLTAVSIFVNPTQFNQPSDFTLYPRTLEADLDLLKQSGVDFCLLPDEKEIYADAYCFQVNENKLSQIMEGLHRPGHFTGMLTVVMKLFNLVEPQRAYFGEKDYQQYLLIQKMVDTFFLDIDIISCPTVREPSGLAYSSRNNRLSDKERLLADVFAQSFHQIKSIHELLSKLQQANIEVDYVEEYEGRRYIAVKIGSVRLIDNYRI